MADVEEGDEGDEDMGADDPPAAAAAGGDGDDDFEDVDSEDSGVDLGLPAQGQEGVDAVESDDESEVEDLEVKDSDRLFVCTHQRPTGDAALEVYVYDNPRDHVYLHHDIALPGIPLSVAWHSQGPRSEDHPSGAGSFAAVGSFLPYIEVWDLDVLDAPDPVLTLGGCRRKEENYTTRKFKQKQLKKASHTDAVLTLAWNPGVQRVLASGSADTSVKLWDLTSGDCIDTMQLHKAPVQALCWCPSQPQTLATGSFDGNLLLTDCRTKTPGFGMKPGSTPEAITWSPHAQEIFWCTLESGELIQVDARMAGEPQWRCAAHSREAAGLAANPAVPGLVATAGVDRDVKLWDVRAEPHCIASRDLGQGRVFSLAFDLADPTLLLAAGDEGKPLVYCVRDDVAPHFGSR
eukprot:TRINITY_DN2744_c0_g1_i1.p1 TRINITY_DN2744_c0_g1~~TRINITY_DN2744_c0_g1_i1.p1  ORF type:complete len:466 (+),score=160.49 TRINITY_DN2744_c0_g1_i1:186-1400(+)